jgi:ABC-2 type transport system permease protein
MNWRQSFEGTSPLFVKEIMRFWKVAFQTVGAPVLTGMLYLLIFGHVLEAHVEVFPGVRYTSFLIPGLVMMSLLQNAFANASSSLIQSKITGNLVFVLLTPLSHRAWFVAYVGASLVRGLVVGFGVFAVTAWFAWPGLAEPWWMLTFAVLGGTLLGTLGLIAGLWAEKFDQLAAFQNFVIVPMTFLSGVFYSVHSLPPFWQSVSHLNPFFYLIDGFRRGFFGVSDVSPWLSLAVVGTVPRPWSPCWPCACSKPATKSVTDCLKDTPWPTPPPTKSSSTLPPACLAPTSPWRAMASISLPPSSPANLKARAVSCATSAFTRPSAIECGSRSMRCR